MPQVIYYHPGAGTEKSRVAQFLGGAFGYGVPQLSDKELVLVGISHKFTHICARTLPKLTVSSATITVLATSFLSLAFRVVPSQLGPLLAWYRLGALDGSTGTRYV